MSYWRKRNQYLKYKCEWYGKNFLEINPKFTSQMCSKCKTISKKSRESQSRYCCVECGFKLNADHNAAKNILIKGLALA